MEHQSLYRRYRSQTFGEMRGQEHVVKALRNAVRENRVGHAYLLSGPRGTGKTSAARILAKALNCENLGADGEPCTVCESCKSIEDGRSFDLHELDAASNNKVDDMRELLAKVALGTPGRTKVYLLDEVHMLTSGAENALLKTLEEPPDHVVFVLATTEPHKVVPTIVSRTQHLRLTLISADELADHVRFIIEDAGLDVGEDAVDYVIRAGGGSARDTLSALDQVVAAGGVADDDTSTTELLEALAAGDVGRAIGAVEQATRLGRDPRVIGERLLGSLREIFLTLMGSAPSEISEADRERAASFAERLTAARITTALEAIGTALVDMRQSPDPRVDLEVALVGLTSSAVASGDVGGLESRIAELESRIVELEARPPPSSGGQAKSAQSPPPAPPVRKKGGPADAARQQLSAPTPPPKPAPPEQPEASVPEADGVPLPPEPQPDPHDGAEVPETVPQPMASSVTLDSVIQAWPSVLESLSMRAKARYAAGRFVSLDGQTATFSLPNHHHRQRCEDCKAEVEAAMAGRGAPVALTLIADDANGQTSASPDSSSTQERRPTPEPQAEEDVDVTALTDATDAAGGLVDRLQEAFPGSEVIEESN